MLENLFNLVKEHAGDAIINNPAIPNEKNDDAIHAASSSIFSGLQNAFANGGTGDIMSLFSDSQNSGSTSIAQNIHGGFVENLVSKLGIDSAQASSIATTLIPSVLQNFVHKTNDPNDKSFDLQGILGSLTGGGQSNAGTGIMDMVKGFMN
ncbi:MAG TPA: DUF937 domain-containing protein [Panacibacter sp.]|nr:DUF937 domain-containing protein [Panacibacter sp.]HNP44824.1 DUF937 domain-containing protein [Panacibacter sp.]